MFNEKDLITWSTRDKAKIGKKYYFFKLYQRTSECRL